MSGATTDWQARRSRATRHAPDLTATVAREPVSDAMLTLAEAEGGTLAPVEAPALCARCQPVTTEQADALAAWEASVRRAVAEDRAQQGRATDEDRETMH